MDRLGGQTVLLYRGRLISYPPVLLLTGGNHRLRYSNAELVVEVIRDRRPYR